MDPLVNQLARELGEAIAAAVADDSRVAALREKARAEGFDLKISLDAVIGFADRGRTSERPAAPARASAKAAAGQPFEMTATDRRFLKSLRISADEPTEKVD